MGFFSELKDDLSQAVNELMPDEEMTEGMQQAAGEEAEGEMPQVDLDELLNSLEEAEEEIPSEEPVMEETPVPAEPAQEQAAREPEAVLGAQEAPKPEVKETVRPRTPVSPISRLHGGEDRGLSRRFAKEGEKKMDTIASAGTAKSVSEETAVITRGMVLTGDVTSEGSIDLVGTINGNIDIKGKLNVTGTIQGNSKAAEIYAEGAKITGEIVSEGSVKIGQSSIIIGNISATSAVVAGAIKGDIDIKGPVVLDASAIVMGNIKSKSVQINNGAVIEGMCSQCYADVNPTSFFNELKTEFQKVNKK